jgi:hypothetical protein
LRQSAVLECFKAHARRNDQLSIIQESAAILRMLGKLVAGLKGLGPELKTWAASWEARFRRFVAQLLRTTSVKLNTNPLRIGIERTLPPLPKQHAAPRARASHSTPAADEGDSGGGGPDDPDPDPDPERPYIALGIDHKATTPAGPPLFAVLRPFTDPNTVTARLCRHEYTRHHYPEP